MPKKKLYFEVLPLPEARKLIERAQKLGVREIDCTVCGDPVPLEDCKTDEHGKAVHEECYVATTTKGRNRGVAR